MIIICPCGEKKFEVDSNLIPEKGRMLKCGSCDQTWFYEPKEQSNSNILKDIKEEKKFELPTENKEITNINEKDKKIIIEALWDIIYSDEDADMYETNLMRRLSGLLYLDTKVVGDIKEKVRQKKT